MKIICKQDFFAWDCSFHKGQTYDYLPFYYDMKNVISDTFANNSYSFSDDPKGAFYLYDYFYTKEEMRDIKISELCKD